FLVSFLVDARGGAMSGCRHSGVRILVPPNRATMPTRVTCKLVKKEKLSFPPQLLEGEGLATRVLVMGPVGVKFEGPILIEVPHFASLRDKEREICILRSDNGETWYEHGLSATESNVQDAMDGHFDDVENAENFYQRRVTRILTSDLPEYFAIVTRLKQEISVIGPQGGIISSTVIPQVQAVFPEGALTKNIKVGLQVLPISPDLVMKMLGNRIAVSPCVTIEPRRRKFHKPITLTLPLPRASQKSMMNQYASETPTLRLLCSLAGGSMPALWEDITTTTPLTFVQDCVSFTTTVSARFWLMDCQNISDSSKMAMDLYRESILVPMFSRFVVFSKRLHTNPQEARLRVFCVTDDKVEKTLETQEHFEEIATSRITEVLDGRPLFIEMIGNLIPITKSDEQLQLRVKSFHENRLPFLVRIRNSDEEASGRIFFMRDPKHFRNESLPPPSPVCNLLLTLPDVLRSESRRISSEEIDQSEFIVYFSALTVLLTFNAQNVKFIYNYFLNNKKIVFLSYF
ncbi:hypothetical protein HELRODRAFT_72214, partial [Helobdella robusta]|uniref:ZU5 domain-containing protein n=1 Tax=Helobdella robusta TaxID=6412 RepID=T1G0X3_HELRO